MRLSRALASRPIARIPAAASMALRMAAVRLPPSAKAVPTPPATLPARLPSMPVELSVRAPDDIGYRCRRSARRRGSVSRGPGRIERAIRALFDANLDEAFTTDELAAHCYGLKNWQLKPVF